MIESLIFNGQKCPGEFFGTWRSVEKPSKQIRIPGVSNASMPPILLGNANPGVQQRVRTFYLGIEQMFEAWIARHNSRHTQRSYRQDVMDFVKYLGIRWPDEGTFLFTVKVADVQAYRDFLVEQGHAPSTRNHRISALSGFFRYLREAAD